MCTVSLCRPLLLLLRLPTAGEALPGALSRLITGTCRALRCLPSLLPVTTSCIATLTCLHASSRVLGLLRAEGVVWGNIPYRGPCSVAWEASILRDKRSSARAHRLGKAALPHHSSVETGGKGQERGVRPRLHPLGAPGHRTQRASRRVNPAHVLPDSCSRLLWASQLLLSLHLPPRHHVSAHTAGSC